MGKAAGPQVGSGAFSLGIAVQLIYFIIQTHHKHEAIPQNSFEYLPCEVVKTICEMKDSLIKTGAEVFFVHAAVS